MAFISLRQLLDHAAELDYGVPAFNINNMEQLTAIMTAAEKTGSPVIVQATLLLAIGIVIDNSGTLDDLDRRVDEVWAVLRGLAGRADGMSDPPSTVEI